MATTRLKLYNGALLLCGERSLETLSDTVEPRRLLDEVWNDGGVEACLEKGQWKFAIRATRLDYDTGVTPEWGYQYAFAKPTDWVNTSAVCTDEYFREPLLEYEDQAGYIWSDQTQIYVRYVSSDASFGLDFSKWPPSFTEYVKAYLASRIIRKLPGGGERVEDIVHPKRGVLRLALDEAKSRDAMAGPTKFPAPGSWVRARQGSRVRGDRFSGSGNLIG